MVIFQITVESRKWRYRDCANCSYYSCLPLTY